MWLESSSFNFEYKRVDLDKMGFKSPHAKKDFIDYCIRKPLDGELARTKI